MKAKQVRPWMRTLAVAAVLSLLITGPLLYKASEDRTAVELVARTAREEAPVDISLAGRRFLFPRKYLFLPSVDEERTPRDEAGHVVHVKGQPRALYDFGFYLNYPSLQFLDWRHRTQVLLTNRLFVGLQSASSITASKNILKALLEVMSKNYKEGYAQSSRFGLQEVSPFATDHDDLYYQELDGGVATLIRCGRAKNAKGVAMCEHKSYLLTNKYEVLLLVSYPKALLPEWQLIESRVRSAVQKFEVN